MNPEAISAHMSVNEAQYLAQGQLDGGMGETRMKPPTFCFVDDPLYLVDAITLVQMCRIGTNGVLCKSNFGCLE